MDYQKTKDIQHAVDKVRKENHTVLKENGTEIHKGTKYLFLWYKMNIPEWRLDVFKKLYVEDLKVYRAWAIKENIHHVWNYCYEHVCCALNWSR